jgi:enterochelin esterase-like enzyme
MEVVEYESRTVGTRRKLNVYTPPGYDGERRYPVLYLLHGIGGDEGEWIRFAQPDVLLENLIADGKAQPMLLVMPNGRAQKDDRPVGNVMQHAPAFAVFEKDLRNDVIPAVEARFRVRSDREQRAIAGLSMGGGQALNFGLGDPDRFAWIGGFSSAPNTRAPGELLKDPAAADRFRLIWLSCGTRDGLFGISQGVDRYFTGAGIPHVWHVTDGGHDAAEWKQALYHFLQQLKFPAE